MMNQTYDNEADALYIRLREGVVARTEEIDRSTLVDVNEAGECLGIEVLHPARYWPVTMIIERYNITGQDRSLLEAMYLRVGTHSARLRFVAPDQEASADAQLVPAG